MIFFLHEFVLKIKKKKKNGGFGEADTWSVKIIFKKSNKPARLSNNLFQSIHVQILLQFVYRLVFRKLRSEIYQVPKLVMTKDFGRLLNKKKRRAKVAKNLKFLMNPIWERKFRIKTKEWIFKFICSFCFAKENLWVIFWRSWPNILLNCFFRICLPVTPEKNHCKFKNYCRCLTIIIRKNLAFQEAFEILFPRIRCLL